MALKVTSSSKTLPVSQKSNPLVSDLLARIQELEAQITQQHVTLHQQANQRENHDFKESQRLVQEQAKATLLSDQLKRAREELEMYKKQLDEAREVHAQDTKRISAQQQENEALHRRVNDAMAQIALLQGQLKASQDQLTILQNQMRQMGQQIDNQQRQILENQRQQRRLIQQIKPPESVTTSLVNALVLAPLSLFFPSLYPYHE